MNLRKTSNVFFGMGSGMAILLPIAYTTMPNMTRAEYLIGVAMVAGLVATAIGFKIAFYMKNS